MSSLAFPLRGGEYFVMDASLNIRGPRRIQVSVLARTRLNLGVRCLQLEDWVQSGAHGLQLERRGRVAAEFVLYDAS